MPYYQRKQPRLRNFDYAKPNYYYVTICTAERRYLFGNLSERNRFGEIAREELEKTARHFEDVCVDKYVIMPNHVHVIFAIGCFKPDAQRPTLSTVVGQYKSAVSKRIHALRPGLTVWQKSYYDEIIRNEAHYLSVWNYIDGNPSKWADDEYCIQ